jgi:VanZ family protein
MSFRMYSLKWPAVWITGAWLLVGCIVYLSLARLPENLPSPAGDKTAHVAAYALMMFCFMQIYRVRTYRLLIGIGLVLLGVTLEILQGYTGYRALEYADMLANTLGVVVGWAAGPPRTFNLLARIENAI